MYHQFLFVLLHRTADCCCRALFKECGWFQARANSEVSYDLNSHLGFWLDHYKTWVCFKPNHYAVTLDVCLRFLLWLKLIEHLHQSVSVLQPVNSFSLWGPLLLVYCLCRVTVDRLAAFLVNAVCALTRSVFIEIKLHIGRMYVIIMWRL